MPRVGDLAQLVRAPAALSVPGDVIAGAAAAGTLGRRTPALAGASVLLYWAGMAANDWADRRLDAVERPERPIPSGRIDAGLAVGIAAGLTGAGIGLAAAAGGRRALTIAVPLAAAVWAYDLVAKNTAAGPAVMAACRGLDVLLGASAGRPAEAVPAALTVAAHTWTVTALSRREVGGADTALPLRTLAGTALVTASAMIGAGWRGRAGARGWSRPGHRTANGTTALADRSAVAAAGGADLFQVVVAALPVALAGWYATGYGTAQARVVAEPSARRVRAAVGAGITGLPALQGALTARAGAGLLGLAVAAAGPLARRLARNVSPT